MNNNNVFEFLPFYKKFYNNVVQQQSGHGDNKLPVVSFIEFPSYADVLYLRRFVQYFNRFNRKFIDIVYGKRGVRDMFFHKNKKNVSSRGVVIYAKDYKIFSLLLDFMARSSLNYIVKSVFYSLQKSSSFSELVISLNPEKLFTEHSLKKYKLMLLTKFFIGGFLISMMLKHIFNK